MLSYSVFSYLLIDENVDICDHCIGVFSSLENAQKYIKEYCLFDSDSNKHIFDILAMPFDNEQTFVEYPLGYSSSKNSCSYICHNGEINLYTKNKHINNVEQCIEFCKS